MVTASYSHCGQRAARIGPDNICRIRRPANVSASFFQRRHGSYDAKPTRIRCGWPDPIAIPASRCAGIIWHSFWQDATGPLPVPYFQTRFRSSTDVPDNTVQNQPGSDLGPADCVSCWSNGYGPQASRCARIIRPDSGHCFPADPSSDANRIRHVHWVSWCFEPS